MNNKPQTVVLCDLDGCFIDDRWRRHLCDWKNRRFEKYHAGIKDDTRALPVMLEVLKRHKAAGDKIYFTTARPDYAFDDTIAQIQKFIGWEVNKDYLLHMRQTYEEGIPSADLKRDMFNRIRECYLTGTIFYAYDDHGDVCSMYHDCGVGHVYLVNDRIAVNCNARLSATICGKIRGGFSFEAQMYRWNNQNQFYLFAENIVNNHPMEAIFSEALIRREVELDTYHYEGEKEIADCMTKNIETATEALRPFRGDSVDESKAQLLGKVEGRLHFADAQHPVKLDHDSININRDEKERNAELIKEVEKEWLSPDVANLPRILETSAQTFSDRREIYGDSSDQFGRIMAIIMEHNHFAPSMAKEHEMYMFFNHIVGKLVRFANSGFEHIDSIHDIINYAGLVECCVIGINRDLKRIEEEEGNESE